MATERRESEPGRAQPGVEAMGPPLLLVALYDLGRARGGRVRIAPGFA